MKTPTVCFGSTCRRGLTCPCTRKPSSTKWLGSSTNDHARLWDLQPQPNDLMLVLHRPLEPARTLRTQVRHLPRSRKCQFRTRAPQQISSRTFPVVCFVYLSVECPFDKFYGINCRLKLGAKLLYRFFHRRRQISPTVNNVTHRFFDSSQHFLYRNFTVGSCHSAVASSPV